MIAFPVRQKSCFTCINARYGGPLTECSLTGDQVLDETSAAAECEAYMEEEK